MSKFEVRADDASMALQATDMDQAMEEAMEWLEEGWEPTEVTQWVHGYVVEIDEEGDDVENRSITITIDPAEPECKPLGGSHEWESPLGIVGGCKESPGVYGHGGGVTIQEVCVRCGCGKLTDTWAQDRATGKQGLTSITYEPGKYEIPEPLEYTHEQIIDEMSGTDFTPVAHYTSEPYEIFGEDETPVETTCTVDVRIIGSAEVGYTLTTRDEADGRSDDLGTDVYPTLPAAIAALRTLVLARPDGWLELVGEYAEEE